MEKEVVKTHHHHHHHSLNTSNNISNSSSITTTSLRERHILGDPQPSDFVLRWGNRKRLRCMKIQAKDESNDPTRRTTVRVGRRVIKSDNENINHSNNDCTNLIANGNYSNNGHFNLRQRPASPAQTPQRTLRNSESGSAMKGQQNNYQTNGGMRGLASPDRGEKKGVCGAHHEYTVINGGLKTASSDTAGQKGSPSMVNDVVWPPKFVIALTNKEKEEDFMAIKGTKLPQRPKKRAKLIQRTLNLVSPGGWLCDLTVERYEVREKKISKKRPRGLKAMGNYMDSDSD